MKTVFTSVMILLAATIIADNKITPERIARLQARRAKKLAEAGGHVLKPHSGNFARIVSAQSTLSVPKIEELVQQFNSGLNIWIKVSDIKPETTVMETLKKAQALPNTGITLLIIEDKISPTILSAMEDGWAILNIGKLNYDMPPDAVYNERIRKELNRAFAQAFGAGLSMHGPCVMEPAYTLTQLDSIKFPVISPEAMNKIMSACRLKNIPPMRKTTYLRACEEGWAPAPTNAVQKGIWEKVHAIPTDPIKIKFDKSKKK